MVGCALRCLEYYCYCFFYETINAGITMKRHYINNIINSLLYYSGTYHVLKYWNRYRIIIFYVHGVVDKNTHAAWTPLRQQTYTRAFERSLRRLRRHYRFISLDDAIEMLAGTVSIKPYCMVVTFDDGFRNNVTYAMPILKKYCIPATIYLTTGNIEDREPFWFDRLDYALQSKKLDGLMVEIGGEQITLHTSSRHGMISTCYQMINAIKSRKDDDAELLQTISAVISMLESKHGRKLKDIFEVDEWSALLTWDEIRKAANQGMTFGGHAVNHVRLPFVSKNEGKAQLIQSKDMIESKTARACNHFAYPNGDFDDSSANLVQECGYRSAVTVLEGSNKVGDDLYKLRRYSFPVYEDKSLVMAKVCGWFVARDRIRAKFRKVISYVRTFIL